MKPNQLINSNDVRGLAQYSTLILAFVFLLYLPSKPHSVPDSQGYIDMAHDLISGSFFRTAPNIANSSTYIRTPGYPLFLLFGEFLGGASPDHTVILHSFLGGITLCLLSYLLSPILPPLISGASILLVMWKMRGYHEVIATEWLTFCLIILCFGLLFQFFHSQKSVWILSYALVCSLLVLIRPALVVVLPISLVIFLINSQAQRLLSVLILLMLGPIGIWYGLNFARSGHFTIAHFDGYNLFGVGALVGSSGIHPNDSAALKKFIMEVNQKKFPHKGEEGKFVKVTLQGQFSDSYYNHNIYGLAVPLAESLNLNVVQLNGFAWTYGWRSINSNIQNYFEYVLLSLRFALASWLALLVSLFTILLCTRRPALNPVGCCISLLFSIHLAHIGLCSMVQMIIPRYIDLTLAPLIIFTLIGIATYIHLLLTNADSVSRSKHQTPTF